MNLFRMGSEMFQAIDGHTGLVLGEATTYSAAIAIADARKPTGYAKVVGEYTSDGSHWGKGMGRTVAKREAKRWQVG